MLLVFTGILWGVAGCAQDDQDGSKQPYVPPPVPQPPTCEAKPGLTAKQRVVEALGHLEKRDEYDCAEAELNAILQEDPGHHRATDLKEQLTADPQQYVKQKYGGRSFKYTVQDGESISLIAQRYLGDRYKFVILARYNDIAEPRSLNAGRKIRIPGSSPPERKPTRKPEDQQKKPEPAPPAEPVDLSGESLDEARKEAWELNSQGRQEEAISLLERALREAQDTGAPSDWAKRDLADYYAESARQFRDRGEYGGAKLRYGKAIELAPHREDFRAELFEVETSLLPAQARLAKAQDLEQRGDLEGAYAAFGAAVKLNPDLKEAAEGRQRIGGTLKDTYYREAMRARLRGDLELAHKNIDKAYRIDADDPKIQNLKNEIEQGLKALKALEDEGDAN